MCDHTGDLGVCVQPVAKALVGDIDKGNGTAGVHQGDDGGHLVGRQVGACRVVAAAVQQHDVACGDVIEVGHQPREIDTACFAVKVAVFGGFHAQVAQDRRVDWPCRVGEPDRGLGGGHFDQLEALANGTGAARRGHRGDAVARDGVVQHKVDHRVGEGRIARETNVGLGGLLRLQAFFGLFDGTHDRGVAGCVLVDANPKVDLGVARVFAVGGHESQNFIGGSGV